jgi:D-alanine-D-alanine ligase
LPLSEIDYSGFPPDMPRIVSYAGKWIETSLDWKLTQVVAARVSSDEQTRIESTARRAFQALGLRGYGRVDVRLDARNQPFVIDVNANPDVSPDAGFALAAARAKHAYADIIGWIAESALRTASSREAT